MPNVFEQVTAKAAEKLGAVAAAMKGLEGVFTQLAGEHREAATLIARIKSTNEPTKRLDLWKELRAALTAHERAEVRVVYKALEGYDSLKQVVDEHNHQAHRLEELITQLTLLPLEDESWKPMFQRLEAAVKQHVEEEEGEFFPRVQGVIGKAKAEELEAPYLAAKRSWLGQ
jgi:hypothetical protein